MTKRVSIYPGIPQEVLADHQADLWYAVPPWPNSLSEQGVPLTASQSVVLRALQAWHWRWSPNFNELARMTNKSRQRIRDTLVSLRSLGFLDWVEDDSRTLHMTVLGQRAIGLYIGPVALTQEAAYLKMPVALGNQLQAVQGAQRIWKRRWKTPRSRPRWKKHVESASLYQRWMRGETKPPILHRLGSTPLDLED